MALYLGALLSDLAYSASYQVQWTNFASWLIIGGLLLGGFALLWALTELFRAARRSGWASFYVLLLASSWVLGLINAFVHAKDAWASMPAGLILSAVVALLAMAASWVGFSAARAAPT